MIVNLTNLNVQINIININPWMKVGTEGIETICRISHGFLGSMNDKDLVEF